MKKHIFLICIFTIVFLFIFVSCGTKIEKSGITVTLKGDYLKITSMSRTAYSDMLDSLTLDIVTPESKTNIRHFDITPDMIKDNSFTFNDLNLTGTYTFILNAVYDDDSNAATPKKNLFHGNVEHTVSPGMNNLTINTSFFPGSLKYEMIPSDNLYNYKAVLKPSSLLIPDKITSFNEESNPDDLKINTIDTDVYSLKVEIFDKDKPDTPVITSPEYMVQINPSAETLITLDPVSKIVCGITYPWSEKINNLTAFYAAYDNPSVELSWDIVSGNARYMIYKKMPGKNKFELIADFDNSANSSSDPAKFLWIDYKNTIFDSNLSYAVNLIKDGKSSGYIEISGITTH